MGTPKESNTIWILMLTASHRLADSRFLCKSRTIPVLESLENTAMDKLLLQV